jgi:hypothetical protein
MDPCSKRGPSRGIKLPLGDIPTPSLLPFHGVEDFAKVSTCCGKFIYTTDPAGAGLMDTDLFLCRSISIGFG